MLESRDWPFFGVGGAFERDTLEAYDNCRRGSLGPKASMISNIMVPSSECS